MPRRGRLAGSRAEQEAAASSLEKVFRHGDGDSLFSLFARQQDDDAEPLVVSTADPDLFLSIIGQRGSISLLDSLLQLKPSDQNLIFGNSNIEVDPSSERFSSLILVAAAVADEMDFIEHAVLKCGLNIEARDREGLSALDEAARNNHFDCVNVIVTKCGANVNACDESDGMTAAHIAAQAGAIEAISMLQKCGADLRKRTRSGDACLNLANKFSHLALVQWLLRYGAVDAASAREGEAAVAKEMSKFEKKSMFSWAVLCDDNSVKMLIMVIFLAALLAAITKATEDM